MMLSSRLLLLLQLPLLLGRPLTTLFRLALDKQLPHKLLLLLLLLLLDQLLSLPSLIIRLALDKLLPHKLLLLLLWDPLVLKQLAQLALPALPLLDTSIREYPSIRTEAAVLVLATGQVSWEIRIHTKRILGKQYIHLRRGITLWIPTRIGESFKVLRLYKPL